MHAWLLRLRPPLGCRREVLQDVDWKGKWMDGERLCAPPRKGYADLLEPPASGMNVLVWLLPLALLLGGSLAIARTMRRPAGTPVTDAPGAAPEPPRPDDPYLEAVRAETRR